MENTWRMILFFVLVVAILSVFQYIDYKRRLERGDFEHYDLNSQLTQTESVNTPTALPAQKIEPVELETFTDLNTAYPVPQDVEEKLYYVDTPLYRAVFNSQGGILTAFTLKKYGKKQYEDARVELFEREFNPSYPGTLAITCDQPNISRLLSAGHFQPNNSEASIELVEGDSEKHLVLTCYNQMGLQITKDYKFTPDNYAFEVTITYKNHSSQSLNFHTRHVLGNSFGIPDDERNDQMYAHYGPLISVKGKRKAMDYPEDDTEEKLRSEFPWAGLESNYFVGLWIPPKEYPALQTISYQAIEDTRLMWVPGARLNLSPHSQTNESYQAFFGPKEFYKLEAVDPELISVVDYGRFAFIAIPFFRALQYLYNYVHNYGLAIILLTIAVRVVMFFLTIKQMKSMQKMAELKPKMDELRAKYGKNTQELNKQLMELYRREGVNPLGSCLPLLLQLPVFIALYNVLAVSVELRHAPFIFWIHDLSAPDPLHITPVMMGISQYFQQKLTPTATDPAQAKMMMIMPVFLTFISFSFPTGLVIYWFASNLIGILQTYVMVKTGVTPKNAGESGTTSKKKRKKSS